MITAVTRTPLVEAYNT